MTDLVPHPIALGLSMRVDVVRREREKWMALAKKVRLVRPSHVRLKHSQLLTTPGNRPFTVKT